MKTGVYLGNYFIVVFTFVSFAIVKLRRQKLSSIGFSRANAIVALSEEIICRGYLQTRIRGLVKNDTLAVLLVGLLFALMHAPVQAYAQGVSWGDYLLRNTAALAFFHFAANRLFRRYNSLVGPVILHGFWNYSQNLFI